MIRSTKPSTPNEPSSSYLTSFCCCLFPQNRQIFSETTYEKNLKAFSELNIKIEKTTKNVILQRSYSLTNISSIPIYPKKLTRRHSFSTYEDLTYIPKPLPTTSNIQKPEMPDEKWRASIKKIDLTKTKSKFIVTSLEYKKEAVDRLVYPKKYPRLEKLPLNSHSFFEWKSQSCDFIDVGISKVFVTDTTAIRISKATELNLEKQKNEENIAKRTAPHNIALGLPEESITRTGIKTFYVYIPALNQINKYHGFSTTTEALLENCTQVKLSSKEELLSLIACLIHQVDGLHKADVCHMDIKPANICKTKTGLFKLIDRFGSIDFRKKELGSSKGDLYFGWSAATSHIGILNRLLQTKNKDEAKAFGRQFDVFSCGSTIYQIMSALKNNASIKEVGFQESLPHKRTSQFVTYSNGTVLTHRLPACLKKESEINDTLSLLEENQRQVIRRSIDLDPTKHPSIEDLKEAFPISLIKKS